MCHACCDDAYIEDNGLSPKDIGTATLTVKGDAVFCHVCQGEFEVTRAPCPQPDCRSNVISKDADYEGRCHVCGERADDSRDE
jgi:hypothetical protein